MKLHEALEVVRRQGRNGDSELAHVNPREAAILRAMGGSGTVNPKTGLREYFMDSGSPAGDYGGFMGDTTGANSDFGGPVGGYGESAGVGAAPSPTTPQGSEQSFGERVGDFLGLNNPRTAGPALVGALAGTPFGLAALLGQGLADFARERGWSVGPAGPFAEGGNPYEPRGEQIAMAAQAAPSFVRTEMAMPGELSPFLSSGMSPLQQRSAIGTFGTQGVNPAFRSDAARKYYASLLSQELVKPGGSFNENAYMLPVEQQYLGSAFGRNVTTPQQSYEAIRGFL